MWAFGEYDLECLPVWDVNDDYWREALYRIFCLLDTRYERKMDRSSPWSIECKSEIGR